MSDTLVKYVPLGRCYADVQAAALLHELRRPGVFWRVGVFMLVDYPVVVAWRAAVSVWRGRGPFLAVEQLTEDPSGPLYVLYFPQVDPLPRAQCNAPMRVMYMPTSEQELPLGVARDAAECAQIISAHVDPVTPETPAAAC